MLPRNKIICISCSVFIVVTVLCVVFYKTIFKTAMYINGTETLEPIHKSFFELGAKDIDGKFVSFDYLKNKKAILIFNSASKGELSDVNYTQMSKFYDEYRSSGLEILDFPSNNFKHQEPKTNKEIKQWAKAMYQIEFPLMSKINVNGPETSEVYRWLRTNSVLYDKKTKKSKLIPWNYAKFLIDGSTGKVVKYMSSVNEPHEIHPALKELLKIKKP